MEALEKAHSPFRSAGFRHKVTGQVIESGALHDPVVLPEDQYDAFDPGFVDHQGKFFTNEEARAATTGLTKEEHELHKALKDYTFSQPVHNPTLKSYIITAMHNGQRVGELSYGEKPQAADNPRHPHSGYHMIKTANVHPNHQGNGVYGRLLQIASLHTKKGLKNKGLVSPGEWRSEAADGAWERMVGKGKATSIKSVNDPGNKDFFMHEQEDAETSFENIQHEWNVEFKRWMAARTEGRPYEPKRPPDVHKAEHDLSVLMGRGNLKNGPSASHHDVARQMAGYDPESSPEFVAARFLAGGRFASEDAVRTALILYDDDFELAALRTYGLPRNEHYRDLLRNAMALMGHLFGNVQKSEVEPTAIPRDIRAATPEGEKLAEIVRKAQAAGQIHPIQLDPNAKHSKGTALATDVDTEEQWLLKPGSGKLSPSAGVHDDPADQSNREVAFVKIAQAVGLGKYYPEAELLLVDGQPVACLKLLGTDYKGMEKLRQADSDFRPDQFFKPYLHNGDLYRWAFLDWVLGNPDCHANNLMVNGEKDDVKLIDHGSAFAGVHFDPAHDAKSFIPFYLRAWSLDRRWSKMKPQEKEDAIPRLNETQAKEFGEWIDDINEAELTQIMQRYGLQTAAILTRLQQLKAVDPLQRADTLIANWVGILS